MGCFAAIDDAYGALGKVLQEYGSHLPALKEEYPKLGAAIKEYRAATEQVHEYSSRLAGLYQGMTESGEMVGKLNWNEQAARSAQDYLDYTHFSRSGLIDQLEYEGFTPDQAEYGVNAVGL